MPDHRFLIFFLLLALAVSSGTAAGAGAWPRGAGQTFLSFGETTSADDTVAAPAAKIYAEYGISKVTTFSSELRFPKSGVGGPDGYVSLSRRITTLAGGGPVAVSARLGFRETSGNTTFSLAPGLHLGRGFRTTLGTGWISLDGWVHVPLSGGGRTVQVDGQIGSYVSGDWMVILGASQYGRPGSSGVLTVTPSAAWRLGEGRTMQFSYSEELGDEPATSMEASLWMEF